MGKLGKAVLLLLLITACKPKLDHGYVTARHHQAAYTDTVFIPIQTSEICTPISNGKYTTESCTPIFTPFPFVESYPETWWLHLEECGNGKCDDGDVYVSQKVWNSINVGSYYAVHARGEMVPPTVSRRRCTGAC